MYEKKLTEKQLLIDILVNKSREQKLLLRKYLMMQFHALWVSMKKWSYVFFERLVTGIV
jgi:hypothetical protein